MHYVEDLDISPDVINKVIIILVVNTKLLCLWHIYLCIKFNYELKIMELVTKINIVWKVFKI